MEIAPDAAFISWQDRTLGETFMPPPQLAPPDVRERCMQAQPTATLHLSSCSTQQTLEIRDSLP